MRMRPCWMPTTSGGPAWCSGRVTRDGAACLACSHHAGVVAARSIVPGRAARPALPRPPDAGAVAYPSEEALRAYAQGRLLEEQRRRAGSARRVLPRPAARSPRPSTVARRVSELVGAPRATPERVARVRRARAGARLQDARGAVAQGRRALQPRARRRGVRWPRAGGGRRLDAGRVLAHAGPRRRALDRVRIVARA